MRFARRTLSRALILLYHRVTSVKPDPQALCVRPENFEAHLDVVQRLAGPTALADLRAARGPSVAVTFDDGYVDNLTDAAPLLEAAGVPATIFVVSGQVGSSSEFWWDDLERLLLGSHALPEAIDLAGERVELSGPRVDAPEWTLLDDDAPSARHAAYRQVGKRFRFFDPETRERALEQLRGVAGIPPEARPSHRAVTADELVELAGYSCVEIGAHTVRHPSLASLPVEDQRSEIRASKAQLEAMLGTEVRTFSYPYGGSPDYSADTVREARDAGFALACANVEGLVRRRTDPFELPRFLVRDWDGDEFERRLRGWLGI
jgi:peptidoglycan/xylan/chitin deacetylase (PgdA/CDA1 family)